MVTQLLRADEARNSAFDKALHGTSATAQGGVKAMLGKNSKAHAAATQEYFQHWEKTAREETEAVRQSRTDEYASITRQYYNLATDFYEYAWGESFHFCRFAIGEPFSQAIARHEHYLASQIGIDTNMKVLDVGCGVGGPAREMVKFTGCHVTGLNICQYQVERARVYAEKTGLADNLAFEQGDFMGVYSEILRVLKPGGVFGVYEWFMTEAYDNDSLEQRQIRLDIEQGDGIAQMVKISDGLAAMEAAGFQMMNHRDLAAEESGPPWYWPIGSDLRHAQTLYDAVTVLRMNKWGRVLAHAAFGLLETIGIAPAGTKKTAESLGKAADALVEGGKRKLFTPMYLMVGRKPE